MKLRSPLRLIKFVCYVGLSLSFAWPSDAQPEIQQGSVRLNLQDNVDLKVFIQFVSETLKLQIIYDDQVGNQKITLRTPNQIPTNSLLPLLNSILRSKNLLLIDADVEGWKRIIESKQMPLVAPLLNDQDPIPEGAARPVTQTFVLKYVTAQQFAQMLRPFLTNPGANILAVTETNVLVITDLAPNIATVSRLVELVDRARDDIVYNTFEARHQSAEELATTLKNVFKEDDSNKTQYQVLHELRTNKIVVVGPRDFVEHAMQMLEQFDVSLGMVTKVYRLQFLPAERLDRIAVQMLGPAEAERLYSSTVDDQGNLLIARATPQIHDQLETIRKQMDVAVRSADNPMRFYKLKNANALEVLYTLLALQEGSGNGIQQPVQTAGLSSASNPAWNDPASDYLNTPSMNDMRTGVGGVFPGLDRQPGTPPGMSGLSDDSSALLRMPLAPGSGAPPSAANIEQSRMDQLGGFSQQPPAMSATLPGGARVSAVLSTNSLIIVARPEVHQMYEDLIELLDQRRAQVMIEAKIIAVDTSDRFSLGVEVSAGDRIGSRRAFEFTSFGLSEINPDTGSLRIRPALGFNGTLVDANVADIVVQALASHSRARVLASPRILVNDNSTGQLESVTSIPFESVNASDTVATTSLGGNQQAGTVITATPHISEAHHLVLQFAVEFSTFSSGSTSSRLPPPRQIDRVGSTVTIPNGDTVIVGGLKRIGTSDTLTGIPFLERIPIIRDLTSLQTEDESVTSFFLFIRPVILKNDKFVGLKHLSEQQRREAFIQSDFPESKPVFMR